jgi:hypothetical protein
LSKKAEPFDRRSQDHFLLGQLHRLSKNDIRAGGCKSGSGGKGSPRPNKSFFRVAFPLCRRAISVSSAERSSGTTLQTHPPSLRLQCETWPLRVSSRSTPSATGLKL